MNQFKMDTRYSDVTTFLQSVLEIDMKMTRTLVFSTVDINYSIIIQHSQQKWKDFDCIISKTIFWEILKSSYQEISFHELLTVCT